MSDKQGAPTLPTLTGGGGNNGGSNGGAPAAQQTFFVPNLNVLTGSNVQQYIFTSQVPVGQVNLTYVPFLFKDLIQIRRKLDQTYNTI